jgi:hypothetical protein
MTRAPFTRATGALAAALLLAVPAAAGAQERTIVVIPQSPGLAESALASCAGGAIIGALIVVVRGVGAVGPTAGLFCGLSAAASLVSTVTIWTWRTATGAFD